MNRIRTAIEKAQDNITDIGAKAMVAATNAAGRAMNTKLGRAHLFSLRRYQCVRSTSTPQVTERTHRV